eukprot:TRINITY_DN12561_c0_g2_i10.p1 TRINITY_DN12561_c0_g2~~TRINITY_DN12561_c0_g2_i10.p1  ORF type:complete len:446 (+),score=116.66 TRINITY_DN12561_c0_g2_i10:196-1533(+)
MSLASSPRRTVLKHNSAPLKSSGSDIEDSNNANFKRMQGVKLDSLRKLYEEVEDADVGGVTAEGVRALIERLLSEYTDTDGFASFDTLVERAVTIQHAERVLERLDIDCDGILSFEEFRRCLEHMLDEDGKPRNFHFSLLHADNMVLQDVCEEALHVQNVLSHKLQLLEREHEIMVHEFEQRLQQGETKSDHAIKRAEENLQHMHGQMLAMQQQLTEAKQHADQLREEHSFARSHLQTLSIASFRSRSNSIFSQVSSIHDDEELGLDPEHYSDQELREQLSASHAQIQSLQTELAESSTMILEFSEKVSVQEQEIAQLHAQIEALRADLDDIESFDQGRRRASMADLLPFRLLSPRASTSRPSEQRSQHTKLAWKNVSTERSSLQPAASQSSLQATSTVAFFAGFCALGWLGQRASSWCFECCNTAIALGVLIVTYIMQLADNSI